MGEKFDLQPAQQCTRTEQGHFGETMKEVFQGASGLLAREVTWDQNQWSALQHELMGRQTPPGSNERRDPGPYNKTFVDMDLGGDVYSLGKGTKTMDKDGQPVASGSQQYKDAMGKMDEAAKHIDFNAPPCPAGQKMGLWEDLTAKGK